MTLHAIEFEKGPGKKASDSVWSAESTHPKAQWEYLSRPSFKWGRQSTRAHSKKGTRFWLSTVWRSRACHTQKQFRSSKTFASEKSYCTLPGETLLPGGSTSQIHVMN